jgi:hypothetical protein
MSAALSSFEAPDAYSLTVGFLRCQDTVRVRINVSNQPIFWRRGYGFAGGAVGNWEPEEELPPAPYILNDKCDAIQIRAAIPKASLAVGAKQARVTIATRTRQELGDALA